jgi:hypothetical protein
MEGEGRREKGDADGFDGLALLLDGYFHEDFRTEFGDHLTAAAAFVGEASAEELDDARTALARFIEWAELSDRSEWQLALVRAGGAWRPRSLDPLREVLAALSDRPNS